MGKLEKTQVESAVSGAGASAIREQIFSGRLLNHCAFRRLRAMIGGVLSNSGLATVAELGLANERMEG